MVPVVVVVVVVVYTGHISFISHEGQFASSEHLSFYFFSIIQAGCSFWFGCAAIYLDLEAEAGHAASVLLDGGLAVGRGIRRRGEEHALVALRLLVFADTAGLGRESTGQQGTRYCEGLWPSCGLETELAHTLGLDSASTGLASGLVAREASDG